jgi:hypothetical protein
VGSGLPLVMSDMDFFFSLDGFAIKIVIPYMKQNRSVVLCVVLAEMETVRLNLILFQRGCKTVPVVGDIDITLTL